MFRTVHDIAASIEKKRTCHNKCFTTGLATSGVEADGSLEPINP